MGTSSSDEEAGAIAPKNEDRPVYILCIIGVTGAEAALCSSAARVADLSRLEHRHGGQVLLPQPERPCPSEGFKVSKGACVGRGRPGVAVQASQLVQAEVRVLGHCTTHCHSELPFVPSSGISELSGCKCAVTRVCGPVTPVLPRTPLMGAAPIKAALMAVCMQYPG